MSEIVIYEDGRVKLETTVNKDTIWLNISGGLLQS